MKLRVLLVQRNDELEQRSASRIRLLAAACHDLRQPAHALGMLAVLDTRWFDTRHCAGVVSGIGEWKLVNQSSA